MIQRIEIADLCAKRLGNNRINLVSELLSRLTKTSRVPCDLGFEFRQNTIRSAMIKRFTALDGLIEVRVVARPGENGCEVDHLLRIGVDLDSSVGIELLVSEGRRTGFRLGTVVRATTRVRSSPMALSADTMGR